MRGESRFSDHRPVYGIFNAEVEVINHNQIKNDTSCSNSHLDAEEFYSHTHVVTQKQVSTDRNEVMWYNSIFLNDMLHRISIIIFDHIACRN